MMFSAMLATIYTPMLAIMYSPMLVIHNLYMGVAFCVVAWCLVARIWERHRHRLLARSSMESPLSWPSVFRLGVAAMVEGALDVVVLPIFAVMLCLWEEADEIMWPPAQHSRHWREVFSISALLMAFGTLFLGMGYQKLKSSIRVYQPYSCIYALVIRKVLRWLCNLLIWLNTPATEHFRQLGRGLFLLQLLTGSLFIFDTDFVCALSFKNFIITSMINKAAFCEVLLMWWQWPSFYWCVGQAAVALVISVIGLGSLLTGLLVLIWPGRSWKARLCSTAYMWAALFGMHVAIWVWKVIFPESHSSVAQLWAGSFEIVYTRWMIELCAFHTSVRVTLLDYQQDDTEGDDLEVTRTASDASHTSSAFGVSLGSAANNYAALRPAVLVPADVTVDSNAARLQSHMSSVTAVLTKLGAPQPTAAVMESQQASSPEDVNPQVTDSAVCDLAQLLLESLQQLLQQQQQRHSTAVPLTAAENLSSDLAADELPLPGSPDLEIPEVETNCAVDMARDAERAEDESFQNCEKSTDHQDSEPASEPLERADDACPVSDRRDTDDQRSNAWSAKILQPAAASFKKAAKRLQPSEETKRDFHARRYHRAEKFVQGLHKARRTLAPCF